MKILCDSELVDSCMDGKWMHYSLSFEGCRKPRAFTEKYTIDEEEIKEYRKCECCE